MQTIKTDYSMDRLISQVLTFKPQRLVFPYGWCGHIPFAAWLMKLHQPGIFVELGTHSGNSYFSFCQAAAEYELSALCYAVDTWQGDEHSGEYGADVFGDVSSYNAQKYAGFSTLMRMRFDEALAYFSDGSIDLLHIDGLHTYEAVKADFESWLPKLSDRGIVLFHDINVRERDFGVWRLWEEMSARYPHCAFYHSHGLGALVVGSAVDPATIEAIRSCDAQHVRLLFGTAADAALDRHLRLGAQQQLEAAKANLEALHSRCGALDAQLERQGADIQRQEAKSAELLRQLNAAEEKLTQREGELSESLQKEASQREAALRHESHTRQHVEALTQTVNALQQSLSWKITTPLRWMASPLAALMRKGAVVRKSIELGGGFRKTAALLLQVLRREGVQGVRWRLNQAQQLVLLPGGANSGRAEGQTVAEGSYQEWLRRHDPTDEHSMRILKEKVDALHLKTKFSVVMPVYNPPIEFLRQAIESVQAQVYSNWELCIADDLSTNPQVQELLRGVADSDPRIKVVYRDKNGHISAASNSALAIASGEFVCLMDHDDLLSPHALAYVAMAIHDHPDAQLLYSDEDKIDTANSRYDPYFKCEFNYELFLAQNMVSHLGVYRRSLLERIGGFREGFEGAQDWDLALRVIEKIESSNIIHIPRVLYHWRAFSGSTALAIEEKGYASKAQIAAVTAHMMRIGKGDARIGLSPHSSGLLRVQFALPQPLPKVSIVIPTKDKVELLKVCVESIFDKTDYKNYEIIIVNNNSEEERTFEYFEELKRRGVGVLDINAPFNYSSLNNRAVSEAKGEYICLLNNDIEIITPDWLSEMISFAAQPSVGCVGARLWYPDGTLQHAGVILGVLSVAGHVYRGMPRSYPGYFGRAWVHQSMSAVTAACLVVEKRIYEEVGGLDERFAVAFNDIDFCIRVREAGYRNVWTPYAEMIHHESATRGAEDNAEKKARFNGEVNLMFSRWGEALKKDPSYSPNLSLDREDSSLAWPSRVPSGFDLDSKTVKL